MPGKEKMLILSLGFGAFMGSYNISLLNISLPTIARYFDVPVTVAAWTIIVYLIVLSATIVSFGKLADINGFKKLFTLGFIIFSAGALLCGISTDISQLILFRIIQAAGGAIISALAPAIVINSIPEQSRGISLGLVATLASAGIAIGAVTGGFITEFAGWRYIFFINVPIGILGAYLGSRYIPDDVPGKSIRSLDIAGTVLIVLAITTLLFALNQGMHLGWSSTPILVAFATSVILWAVFVKRERRVQDPVLDFGLFKNRSFTLANLSGLVIKFVFTGIIIIFTLYFEIIEGFSVAVVGFLLMVPAAASLVTAPVAGTFSDRIGSRRLCMAGGMIGLVVFLFFFAFTGKAGIMLSAAALILFGLSIGVFLTPNRKLILGHSPPDKRGVSSGLMKTFGNFGSAIGIVLFGMVVEEFLLVEGGPMQMIHTDPMPSYMISSFSYTFLAAAVLCFVCVILAYMTNEP